VNPRERIVKEAETNVLHYSARFASDARSLRTARHAVRTFATACGLTEAEIHDVVLAAGEALANAVEHGRSLGAFSVECRFLEGTLSIEVADEGRGFADWHQVQAARRGFSSDASQAGAVPVRGFGIKIMYEMMDEVTYQDGGRKVRLVKHRALAKSEESTGTGET
jgi:anti-sigma regulatory factor (Ser/Thr protein kinase)